MVGDALAIAGALPPGIAQCIATSPPYWGHRSYLPDDHADKERELGRERTPEEYVDRLVAIFRALRPALRDDGTLWLNLGDTIATRPNGGSAGNLEDIAGHAGYRAEHGGRSRGLTPGVKHKDLYGIPWMVAFALRADGWYLRSDIVWSKTNPMPESIADRPTRSHEYLFLLTKRPNYFYDGQAIAEPVSEASLKRIAQPNFANQKGGAKDYGEQASGVNRSRSMRKTLENFAASGAPTRAKRDVWSIPTLAYSGAHFATFPPELVRPCILAGTSERGACAKCGQPWIRLTETEHIPTTQDGASAYRAQGIATPSPARRASRKLNGRARVTTIGWRAGCACDAGVLPCLVLDPFIGSGTTAEVCTEEARDWLGIDLNGTSVEMTAKRLARLPTRSLFAGIGG